MTIRLVCVYVRMHVLYVCRCLCVCVHVHVCMHVCMLYKLSFCSVNGFQ